MFATNLTNMANLVVNVGKLIWAPIKFAFSLIWEPIKETAVAGFNAVVEAVLIPINKMIDGVNLIAGAFGTEIANIDFTPLTVDAPRTASQSWETFKDDASTSMAGVLEAGKKVGVEAVAGWQDTGKAIGKNWQDMPDLMDPGMRAVLDKHTETGEEIVEEFTSAGHIAGKALVEEVEVAATTVGQSSMGNIGTLLSSKFSSVFGGDLKGKIGGELAGAFESLLSGGKPADVLGDVLSLVGAAVGGALGGMIAGPIGAKVGAMIGEQLGALSSLFGGEGKAEKRKDVLGKVQNAIRRGDLRGFGAGGDLRDTLKNAGSAKLTLDAFMATFGLEETEAMDLIQLLSNRERDNGQFEGEFARFNELMGALEERARLDLAAELVPAAQGFSGRVVKPTLFLAGEAGPEQVDIVPQGQGRQGEATIIHLNIERIETPSVQSMRDWVEGEFGPLLKRFLRDESIRGTDIMTTDGLLAEPTV